MISLDITGRHFEVDDKIGDYLDKKIGSLDKYLPKTTAVTHASVVLAQDASNKEGNENVCEVIIDVKKDRFQATEATSNMYAAIDICEQKLKSQITRYKDKHDPARNRGRRIVGKLFGVDSTTTESDTEQS